jgi:hypothetical protein
MDANLERPDPQFAKFLDTCGLHDMLAEKYPNPTATHTKGNRLHLVLGDDLPSSAQPNTTSRLSTAPVKNGSAMQSPKSSASFKAAAQPQQSDLQLP